MSSPSSTKLHNKYYFEDGDVVFLTNDNIFFRLHKFILKYHSKFFEEMFELKYVGTEGSATIDGSSDENPIRLRGGALGTLQAAELESICQVLYDMPGTALSNLNTDAAILLLHVSSKFQFEDIHKKAAERLENTPLSPTTRYELAMDCLLDHWVVRAWVDICLSISFPLTANLLEFFTRRNAVDALLAVLKVRESYRARLLRCFHESSTSPYPFKAPTKGPACTGSCRRKLQGHLKELLNPDADAHPDDTRSDAHETLKIYLHNLITEGKVVVCIKCYKGKDAVVSQLLCPAELENEIVDVIASMSS